MAAYLNLIGASGDVTHQDYSNWIELSSLEFSVENGQQVGVGKVMQHRSSVPVFAAIKASKFLDASSNFLFQHVCDGCMIHAAEIHVLTAAGVVAVKYLLSGVRVIQHRCSSVGDAQPVERLELSYQRIQITTQTGADAKTASPSTSGYSLLEAQAL